MRSSIGRGRYIATSASCVRQARPAATASGWSPCSTIWAFFDNEVDRLEPIANPFGPKLLPIGSGHSFRRRARSPSVSQDSATIRDLRLLLWNACALKRSTVERLICSDFRWICQRTSSVRAGESAQRCSRTQGQRKASEVFFRSEYYAPDFGGCGTSSISLGSSPSSRRRTPKGALRRWRMSCDVDSVS